MQLLAEHQWQGVRYLRLYEFWVSGLICILFNCPVFRVSNLNVKIPMQVQTMRNLLLNWLGLCYQWCPVISQCKANYSSELHVSNEQNCGLRFSGLLWNQCLAYVNVIKMQKRISQDNQCIMILQVDIFQSSGDQDVLTKELNKSPRSPREQQPEQTQQVCSHDKK